MAKRTEKESQQEEKPLAKRSRRFTEFGIIATFLIGLFGIYKECSSEKSSPINQITYDQHNNNTRIDIHAQSEKLRQPRIDLLETGYAGAFNPEISIKPDSLNFWFVLSNYGNDDATNTSQHGAALLKRNGRYSIFGIYGSEVSKNHSMRPSSSQLGLFYANPKFKLFPQDTLFYYIKFDYKDTRENAMKPFRELFMGVNLIKNIEDVQLTNRNDADIIENLLRKSKLW